MALQRNSAFIAAFPMARPSILSIHPLQRSGAEPPSFPESGGLESTQARRFGRTHLQHGPPCHRCRLGMVFAELRVPFPVEVGLVEQHTVIWPDYSKLAHGRKSASRPLTELNCTKHGRVLPTTGQIGATGHNRRLLFHDLFAIEKRRKPRLAGAG